jgi:hypothetical protein
MEIQKNSSECAFHKNIDGTKTCMSDDFIKILENFAFEIKKIKNINRKDVIDHLKTVYNCKNESCLLKQQEIINILGTDNVNNQLNENFKPPGPYEGTEWFSNNNIDNVLQQIAIKYKKKHFLHIKFQMRDFQKTCSELARLNLVNAYKNGMRCFGVVFNTDDSSGRGQHWYSIFGDFQQEPFTIEYFNSVDDPPQNEILNWLTNTRDDLNIKLNKVVKCKSVCKLKHQRDNHSCGSYSLYYIISRLEGISYKYFMKNIISDKMMHDFRYTLFRKEV